MTALYPDWHVPNNVKALMTTRTGGVSLPPFNSLNLGDHVGDDPSAVKNNRDLLVARFALPNEPLFLTQTHSTRVLTLPYHEDNLNADAAYTNQPNQVCVVMTADCLPVLLASKKGNEVAAAHAGWRGLCDGILEETVAKFQCPRNEIVAWFGAAIGPTAFQVGYEVVAQFIAWDKQAEQAFIADPNVDGKYLGNLYQLATQRLNKLGVIQISGGDRCTYTEKEQFFSYRRDGKTGRMASTVWFE